MAEIKLTKNELKNQQLRLAQLEKYLPTLQLKKAMLQVVVQEVRQEIEQLNKAYENQYRKVGEFSSLLNSFSGFDFPNAMQIKKVHQCFENIAGVEIPHFVKVEFVEYSYALFDTPFWTDAALIELRKLVESKARVGVAKQKKEALEKELREVSIRVNLFEKILIPRALRNLKKIKIFLGDQQLAAVSQAKIAKTKISAHSEPGESYAQRS